jgi:hypothetical protein
MVGEIAGSTLLAVVVTKLVDLVRKFDKKDKPLWKGCWIILALGIGVGLALLCGVNVLAELGLPPSNRLEGVAGEILTGLLVGGFGSGWHEVFDAFSSIAKLARANALAQPLTAEDLRRVWGADPPREVRDQAAAGAGGRR